VSDTIKDFLKNNKIRNYHKGGSWMFSSERIVIKTLVNERKIKTSVNKFNIYDQKCRPQQIETCIK